MSADPWHGAAHPVNRHILGIFRNSLIRNSLLVAISRLSRSFRSPMGLQWRSPGIFNQQRFT
jgi:hypothetical protein